MFLKKPKEPKDGDYVSYVEELQKEHFKTDFISDSAKESLFKPIEQSVDKIKDAHENTINKLKKENSVRNLTEGKQQDNKNINIKHEETTSSPADNKNTVKQNKNKSKRFNKVHFIPLIVFCMILGAFVSFTEMPLFFLPLFIFVIMLGIMNNSRRKK